MSEKYLLSDKPEAFPTLTPAQVARIAKYAHVRQTQPGILIEAGVQNSKFFVITVGQLDSVRPSSSSDQLSEAEVSDIRLPKTIELERSN